MEKPYLFDPVIHTHLIPSLVSVHATCITSPPYTIATFLPPLNNSKMTSWWEDRVKEVANRTRHLIMQLATNVETGKEEVVGYVMCKFFRTNSLPFAISSRIILSRDIWERNFMLFLERSWLHACWLHCYPVDMPFAETGPFRGVVEKLLVSPAWRKKGIARALMKKLEEVAQKEGRSLLVSDWINNTIAIADVKSRLWKQRREVQPSLCIRD